MRAKFLLYMVIAGLAFCLTGAIAGSRGGDTGGRSASDSRSYKVISLVAKDKVNPDGSVEVDEMIGVNFDGVFRGFNKDMPFRQDQTITKIQAGDRKGPYDPGGDATIGSPGADRSWGYAFMRGGKLFRVVWHHNTIGYKDFRLMYKISRASESFSDYDVVRARVSGDRWQSGLDLLSATLSLPAKPVSAQAAPAYLNPQVIIKGDQVSVTAQNIPKKKAVDLLIKLPKGSIPGAVKKTGKAPELKDSFRQQTYARYLNRPAGWLLAWGLAFLLLVALPATLWLYAWKARLKDPEHNAGGTQYEPPPGSLALGYKAAEEENPDPSKAMTATLMDLIARGFYKRENVQEDGEWRLKISRLVDPESHLRSQEELSEGELATFHYFNNLLTEGPCRVDQLGDRVDESQNSVTAIKRVHIRLTDDADKFEMKQPIKRVKLVAGLWVFLTTWISGIALTWFSLTSIWSIWILGGLLIASTLAAIGVGTWPKGDFYKLNREEMEVAGPWRSYRDFITSFSSMETAPALQVELWERAFAAAMIFGVAKEFAEQAKILVPDLDTDTLALGNTTYYSVGLASSMMSSATPEVSGSSGGGYSGGGGFGGGGFGGGGGGAW